MPEQKLIEDFNLHVQPGQRIAIVGPTGCGKTTLINLLMRFYDADSGHIQVSGHDVMHMTRHSLRKNYGMVLQETWLKKGTIRENICMGKPDAIEEEMIAAAKQAMHTALSADCRKGMILRLQKMGAICHRDKSSFFVLPVSCYAFRRC